ncbi:hypothetical protein NSERUTF1_2838 [Nocardia seriolae]|nr:hypothetical protein NSERUTF1_2838 [Nocardia seriolae]
MMPDDLVGSQITQFSPRFPRVDPRQHSTASHAFEPRNNDQARHDGVGNADLGWVNRRRAIVRQQTDGAPVSGIPDT